MGAICSRACKGVIRHMGSLRFRCERGASAVEYGIVVSLIAAVIVIAVYFLGTKTSSAFSCTASNVGAGTAATGC